MSVAPAGRDAATAEFFDATARGVFLIRRCGQCQTATEPSARSCPACGSADLRYEEASGGASVVSWSVTRGRPEDGAADLTVLVIAELDEGPWWWSQALDADPDTMREGQRLRIAFARSGEHEMVPVFRLADPSPSAAR
jgi:uncharacterized OB-fold protein